MTVAPPRLGGIGPATASAVLSTCYPALTPFMADEAMEAIPGFGGRAYTESAYTVFRDALADRAARLTAGGDGLEPAGGWTAEAVGRALWACAQLSAAGLANSPSLSPAAAAAAARPLPRCRQSAVASPPAEPTVSAEEAANNADEDDLPISQLRAKRKVVPAGGKPRAERASKRAASGAERG